MSEVMLVLFELITAVSCRTENDLDNVVKAGGIVVTLEALVLKVVLVKIFDKVVYVGLCFAFNAGCGYYSE